MKPIVHVSNDFRILRRKLTEDLFFSNSPPFEKKIVILPDLKMKNDLMLSFLKQTQVVLGIDFMELGTSLQFLTKTLASQALNFPSLDLLTLHILSLIEKSGSEKRDYNLAASLAMEFLRYGKFGAEEYVEWKRKKGWQQMIWDAVFSKWETPAQLLELSFQRPAQPLSIYLYKFPFLPELYHHFFEKLATICSVYYYQFSPCATFWTDIFSEKERFYLEKKIDAQVRNEWSSYLKDRPLLLAHLGGLARQTFRFFETADFPLNEWYQSPQEKTLLKQVQNQILNYQEKQSFKEDNSILLHLAASKLREVEILYTTLLSFDFKPSDIRVYAPDIASYAPFISLVFGGKDSPFPFSVSGLPKEEESSLFQTFIALLSLNRHRFKREAVFRLFACKAFQKKFHLKQKDVEAFTLWMEKADVKWGLDREHRKELLGGKEMLDEGDGGTWENAFHFILDRFVKLPKKRPLWEKPLLDFSEAKIFGICISILRSLKRDLTFLENASLSLSDWSQELHLLLNRYFEVEELELSSFKWIEEKLTLLSLENLPKNLYRFYPLLTYLKNAFEQKVGKKEASQAEAIRFSSLKLGASDDAPVICLLGLDENQFPRLSSKSSICELELKKEPLTQQEDRHLFLELLFAASSHFILSYVSINEEDGKEQGPSPIIQELLNFLDPVCITKRHPPFLFHADYFDRSNCLSELSFLAAKKYYCSNIDQIPFIPEFFTQTAFPNREKESLSVDLRNLRRFAKNPLRFYFNHKLNVFFQYEGKDEEFTLSPLNQNLLRERVQTCSFSQAFQEAEKHAKLPLGRFKEVTHQMTFEELQNLQKQMNTLNLREPPYPLGISFKVALNQEREALLKGTLPSVTSAGLLFYGEKKWTDLLQIWPLYLVYACQTGKDALILTQSGDILTFPHLDPKKALITYLLYYEKAQTIPSPFFPAWGSAFLEQEPETLAKKIQMTTDPYALRVFRPNQYDVETIFKTWAPLFEEVFRPLKEVLR